jgi:hypothetical protein
LREAADWILSFSLKESHNKDEVRV